MTSPALEASSLSFGYTPGQEIISGWDAQFPHGSITALTGRSGRGKSTALYLLGLMLRPTGGDILVEGLSTTGMKDREKANLRAQQFGFVFQDAALDPNRSVLDNVTEGALYLGVPRADLQDRGLALLDQFGVDVPASRKPTQISGGQAQRIALCRALVHHPNVILADEPTGNLDPHTGDIVTTALIEHARNGAAVIVVTHSPDLAARCDRELML
ncbi:ABC transporter ATP-binding protein [Timonella senegalensis]|uniref:ABC transporter ATP-binding protein n=1 Tax=Timonella senegalensis TaxID=1465825 RepID=UPI0028B19E33|nr:ATP-binding cassette domain-containing protein [Timonella senegalensis]